LLALHALSFSFLSKVSPTVSKALFCALTSLSLIRLWALFLMLFSLLSVYWF
jgi:hypothetical protein